MAKKKRENMTLKELRKDAGMTQVQCALKCEVSIVTWQNWERGVTSPSEENIKKITKLFN